jgi:hypothetical protein
MPKLTLEQLAETAEFQCCTAKEKLCIATFISNNYDQINAIRTAYPCANDHVALLMSYAVFGRFKVQMAVAAHFNDDPQQAFLHRLVRDIAKGKIDPVKLRAYTLYAEVKGWKTSPLLEAIKIAKEIGLPILADKTVDTRNLKKQIDMAIGRGTRKRADGTIYVVGAGKRGRPKVIKESDKFDLSDFESDK